MLTNPFQMYNDGDYLYGPSSYQRMAHEAEMRRRAELYYRMKAEEEAQRRRESEMALYRKMKREEELRDALAGYPQYQGRSLRGLDDALHRKQQPAVRSANGTPKYALVRGLDGRLYRVKAEEEEEQQTQRRSRPTNPKFRMIRTPSGMLYRVPVEETVDEDEEERSIERLIPLFGDEHKGISRMHGQEEKKTQVPTRSGIRFMNDSRASLRRPADEATVPQPRFVLVRGRDGNLYKVPIESESRAQDTSRSPPERQMPKKATGSRQTIVPTTMEIEKETKPVHKAPKKQNRRKVTVIVEDASDDESEDDYQSIWRNRRPSPGQWIEPVEGF